MILERVIFLNRAIRAKTFLLYFDDLYGIVNGDKLNKVDNFEIIHPNDVIVELKTSTEVTHSSGIILTATASSVEDRPTKGIIIKIGSAVTTVKIGDVVEIEVTAGIDLSSSKDGTHYTLLDVSKIVGIYH